VILLRGDGQNNQLESNNQDEWGRIISLPLRLNEAQENEERRTYKSMALFQLMT